jgi:phosphoserine aminotransferase
MQRRWQLQAHQVSLSLTPVTLKHYKLRTVTRVLHNFNAGPSILPREVFDEASQAILNFNDTGLSILEIGHRTKIFQEVMDEAAATMRELMGLDGDHEVLFLHGGASTQFLQVPMNLLGENDLAAYTDTGVWASKAIKEARLFGHIEVVCSSKAEGYTHLPKSFSVPKTARYLHVTTNNTIYGTQWQDLSPIYSAGVPVVADMSSDILSRDIDFNRFDVIYAGAQKNVGAAGVTIAVINKNILGKVQRQIPSMLDYRVHITNGSMYNTPPVFSVYVCLLTLRWLKNMGGVRTIESINNRKASLLYDTIDALPVFKGTVATEDRSKMNVCFVAADDKIEKEFLELCQKEGMIGVKGHRSVGGFRLSLYNALPLESVEAITDLMKHFAQRKS